jgi:hypothetical protein
MARGLGSPKACMWPRIWWVTMDRPCSRLMLGLWGEASVEVESERGMGSSLPGAARASFLLSETFSLVLRQSLVDPR